jgi:hypothetical protein
MELMAPDEGAVFIAADIAQNDDPCKFVRLISREASQHLIVASVWAAERDVSMDQAACGGRPSRAVIIFSRATTNYSEQVRKPAKTSFRSGVKKLR